jgi:hypothetical protein
MVFGMVVITQERFDGPMCRGLPFPVQTRTARLVLEMGDNPASNVRMKHNSAAADWTPVITPVLQAPHRLNTILPALHNHHCRVSAYISDYKSRGIAQMHLIHIKIHKDYLGLWHIKASSLQMGYGHDIREQSLEIGIVAAAAQMALMP